MEEVIVIDDSDLSQFMSRFDFHPVSGLDVDVISIEDLPPYHDMHFQKYMVDFGYKGFKISAEIIISKFEKRHMTRKLQFTIQNNILQNQLKDSLHHFSRRRKLKYALSKLVSFWELHLQREAVISLLKDKVGRHLKINRTDNGEIVLTVYRDADDQIGTFYFEATWKLYWYCRRFEFLDYIDFEINIENVKFYEKSKAVFEMLAIPTCEANIKLTGWDALINLLVEDFARKEINRAIQMRFISGRIDISDPDIITDDEDDDDDLAIVN